MATAAIKIGQLRDVISIQSPTPGGDFSGKRKSWHVLARPRARVTPMGGGEQINADQVVTPRRYQVVIPWRRDVTAECRIVYRGQTLEIVATPEDLDGSRRWLLFEAVRP